MAVQYSFQPRQSTGEVKFQALVERSNEQEERRPHRSLPAEWAPQSGVQLTWPHADTDWAYMLDEVTETYVRMAYEIALREPLLIVTPHPTEVEALLAKRLPAAAKANIRFFECATNDTWARDHGFITVFDTAGPELLDFRFNGWGGKFEAALDNAINACLIAPTAQSSAAAKLSATANLSAAQLSCASTLGAEEAAESLLHGHYVDCLDFELEGGAIESDGCGTILTTAECLLNENRRHAGDAVPTVDKAQVEAVLRERLGAERILWLDHGYLAGDDTDSHIDTLARLCPNDTIVYVRCDDPADEHYEALCAMEEQLRSFRTADGEPYTLIPVPLPRPCFGEVEDEDGTTYEERLPATYANFLIMNDAVLMPTYNQPDLDAQATEMLQRAFPNHEIVGIDCRSLIRQHGSLHCCTMQFPRGVMPEK